MQLPGEPVVLAILAWEYRRRSRTIEANIAGPAAGWLAAVVPVTLLGMLSLESFALGHMWQWSEFTVLGLITAWSADAALVVVVMALNWGPRWLERIAAALFALLGLLLVISLLGTLNGWRSEWSYLEAQGPPLALWWWPVVNPRGLGFIAAIVSAVTARDVRPVECA
jgi:hypothetical protein